MKMLTRWVPGGILVAVAEGGVLALDGSAQAMEAMWAELTEHRCLGDLLRSLSRLHDNEVFTLPDFLMMAIDGQELRVAARGRFCLHLDTADGERSFNASEVIVWEESRYDRVNQCILELTPATGRAAGPEQFEELLPLRSGIVRASQLHIGFGSHCPHQLRAALTGVRRHRCRRQSRRSSSRPRPKASRNRSPHRHHRPDLRRRARRGSVTRTPPIQDGRWDRSPWTCWPARVPCKGPAPRTRPRCWVTTTFLRPLVPQTHRYVSSKPRTSTSVISSSTR